MLYVICFLLGAIIALLCLIFNRLGDIYSRLHYSSLEYRFREYFNNRSNESGDNND